MDLSGRSIVSARHDPELLPAIRLDRCRDWLLRPRMKSVRHSSAEVCQGGDLLIVGPRGNRPPGRYRPPTAVRRPHRAFRRRAGRCIPG